MQPRPERPVGLGVAWSVACVSILGFLGGRGWTADTAEMALPSGVKAVWDLDKAHRQKTRTRERVCLNGLWRWQPAQEKADAVPNDAWGFFKIPGFWPGAASYIQEDSQTLHAHPDWRNADLRQLRAAWYQREFTVPADWTGRRIALAAEYVNSFAVLFVDGKKAGDIRFPAGEVDLTTVCKPGSKHVLSLLVVALPLQGVLLSYSDTNAVREVQGSVERRGLCGNVWLVSTPAGPRITDVQANTSVRKGEINISAALVRLAADRRYQLRIQIREAEGQVVRELTSQAFQASDLQNGRLNVERVAWLPKKLWDIHTPWNMHQIQVTLAEANGQALDTFDPVRFGFREFWIDGKHFYLNGARIFLSAVPLDNGQIGARTASYAGALETMKRLKSFGINFVYTHNYGCQPGSHISFAEILRAADDIGMLVGFSQPHFGHYNWKIKDAERANGYARHAGFYVRAAQNHPSVVAYAMSHNATGYDQDMNPDLIDGLNDPRKDTWSLNNSKLALRAEAIVRSLDPGRIVYHHSSGNLGSMHTSNFYINFAPIQEVSDWFEHWAAKGVKPMFPVEYGVPFSWDWTMYRGWYKGQRNFGSARVPWEFCLAEWNAQFLGDRAFQISESEKQNLRFEAKQFQAGNLWHRWDYPHQVGSRDFDERAEIFARYITDNWRAFRTLGLSANSPWEHHIYWKLKDGAKTGRREFNTDWDTLQKPGFSADYTQRQNWQFITDFEASDWVPTAAAQALMRNNRPLLAYIGGKPGAVTGKDHSFLPGESVHKQVIVINNSRESVACNCSWSVDLPKPVDGAAQRTTGTGDQESIPLHFTLPASLAPGVYRITAQVHFSTGETQDDSFAIHVLPTPAAVSAQPKLALFDPKGDTAKLLKGLKVAFQVVDAKADLADYDTLIIGRNALTPDGPGPDVLGVRDGLKVIVFEQSAATLEQRFGFRVVEYGLREVFPRVPDHPLLAGLKAENLHDWGGEATLVPPRLEFTSRPRYGPTVRWCDIAVPRVWRCGCRGNVASVLIEKPARGDFLSIVDGGYALQYSPLLEYREGKGLVLFCQMDVTGRTENDPVADTLVRNIMSYVSTWKPGPSRPMIYVGDPAGKRHLQAAGISVNAYSKELLTADAVVIVGPGGGKQLAGDCPDIAEWIKAGGRLLAIGLDEANANAILPTKVRMNKVEHIAAHFDAPRLGSPLAGVAPADVHNRDPRLLDLVDDGATILGNGVLAQSPGGNVVFCQIVPWHFDPTKAMNLKRTFRRIACAVTRLAANLGAVSETPILTRFRSPVQQAERRWLNGLYLDVPEEWDDPYRFFRW
jgi:hypothetical protein